MKLVKKMEKLDADIKEWMMRDLTPTQQVVCIVGVIILQIYVLSR